MSRSVEDVERVIAFAKLEAKDLLSQSQVLEFDTELLDQSRIRLVEMDESLARGLEEGDSLVLKGNEEDGAVLCTRDRTFDVKDAETSNSVLILNGLNYPSTDRVENEDRVLETKKVMGIFHNYLDIKLCKPKTKRLFDILGENPISAKHELKENLGKSQAQLEGIIQCSQKELEEELEEIQAVKINGRWYLLTCEYKARIVSLITNYIEENSWKFDNVDKNEVLDVLMEIEPRDIVESVFGIITTQSDGKYSVNPSKLSRCYGEFVLQSCSKFNLADFETTWRDAMPPGIETKLEYLKGIAFIDRNAATICHFPERNLPENIQDRLQVLFDMQEKWTEEEIEPFVNKLTTPQLNVKSLLTKFARCSTMNKVKYFSSKHGK